MRPSTILSRVAAVAALALAAACSDNGPAPVASVTIASFNTTIVAGGTRQLTATTMGAKGEELTGRTVDWTSSNGAAATVSGTGLVTAVAPGQSVITATSEGKSATVVVTVIPIPVETVNVTPAVDTVARAQTITLAAELRGAGNVLLTGRDVTWSVSDTALAAVSGGVVAGKRPGQVTVTATSEGRSGTATVLVTPGPVANVQVSPASATVLVGGTRQYTANITDGAGFAITGKVVAWTSSDTAVATVSTTGLLTARAPGAATVTASVDGHSGTSSATVVDPGSAPLITGVSAALVPGATVSVTGANFGTAGSVTVGGVAVANPQFQPSGTQINITVPCVAGGDRDLVVTASTGLASPAFTTNVGTVRQTLAIGESAILGDAASACTELAPTTAGARWLLTVFSTNGSANALTDVEVVGNPGAGAGVHYVPMPDAAPVGPVDAAAARENDVHFTVLERNRALYQSMRGVRPPSQPSMNRSTAAPPVVGDQRNVFYHFNTCGASAPVMTVRAVYVSARTVVWEEITNTLLSTNTPSLDSAYKRLGEVYERDQHDVLVRYFGDPLRRDPQTDADGRLHMIFTQRLNSTGAAAYVAFCDQFHPSSSASVAGSNFGEFFYGRVPTTATPNVESTASPQGWFAFMTRTVIHEVKHIVSVAARVANNAPTFEASWLEEGSARMAEEMWVRDSLHRAPWKGNHGWGTAASNGLYCDFHLSDATCLAADPFRRPTWGMRRQLNEIRPKLLQPWNWSPYGDGSGQSGAVFYNTTWSLLRWTMDRYATTEASFLTAMMNSTTTGLTNLSTVAGASVPDIIGGWGMALFADDYPGMPTTDPNLQFRTWNLRSIYAGLNAAPAWSATWNTPFPIDPPQVPAGSFSHIVTGLRGGAHAYLIVAGSTSPQVVQLRDIAGALPPGVRLAVARIQ